LADYVQVKGAAFDNGLLQIELVREIPGAMKSRLSVSSMSIWGQPSPSIARSGPNGARSQWLTH
jgi:molecular chaperone IbpA